MKTKLFLLALFSLYFCSCKFLSVSENVVIENTKETDIDSDDKTNPDERLWTILIYMCADNNLETAALNDIYEMEASRLNTDKINVLFLLDRNPSYNAASENWTGTRLYKLVTGRRDSQTSIISTQLNCPELNLWTNSETELDMSDPNTLSAALRFSMERFPASNYGMIMWGHGSGWKSETPPSEQTSPEFYKGFSYDESTDSYMTLYQLGTALKNALGNNKLDFLGFDTCYGGEIEVMYELRDYAKFGCGSEGLVLSDGWNYEVLFNCFENKMEYDVENLMECIMHQFKKQYEGTSRAAIAFCDFSQLEDYVAGFDLFCYTAALAINSPAKRDMVFETLYSSLNCKTERYTYGREGYDVYLDCSSIIENLSPLLEAPENEVRAAENCFCMAEEACIIKSWASDRDKAGLGVYFQTLGAGGILQSNFNSNYINGKTFNQISFVHNCKGYVPTVGRNESLLDKLFY